jgi:hypothetical protein
MNDQTSATTETTIKIEVGVIKIRKGIQRDTLSDTAAAPKPIMPRKKAIQLVVK